MNKRHDVCIIGAGHNGLVSSIILARAGLSVKVHEGKKVVGGAAKTENPFKLAPNLGHSTGAYLLGVMPPELMRELGLNINLIRRDPHYFLPTLNHKYLLLGADSKANDQQIRSFFSDQDAKAIERLEAEIAMLREDLAPSWLQEPLPLEQTADKYIRKELQATFLDLCSSPVEEYLHRFNFKSELLLAMYAVTDGFSGLNASFGMNGTGYNFLVHNMCRLPQSGGTWMIAEGGMGAVTNGLKNLAIKEGVDIETNSNIDKLIITNKRISGVVSDSGQETLANIVIGACDPFKLMNLATDHLPEDFKADLNSKRKMGTTLKLNLALNDLPTFSCLNERIGQHKTTSHLLPQGENGSILDQIKDSYQQVQNGILADFPTIEWYFHTDAEPSLMDADGRHSAALFVQWAPYDIQGSSWDKERDTYENHLIDIAERFAPDLRQKIDDTFMLAPPDIESYFGISNGHIHHIDNAFAFDKRSPYKWPVEGLYAGSAGCHPGGSVIGCSGYNVANRIKKDLEISN